MTHYEELGVSPDAPAEEIRRAFRRTSRLLHPDLQTSPDLRQAAETQMRRLNEVVDLLCEPESRAAYDRSLGRLPAAQTPSESVSSVPPSLLAGLALGALSMLCWSIIASAPSPAPLPDKTPETKPEGVSRTSLAPRPVMRAKSSRLPNLPLRSASPAEASTPTPASVTHAPVAEPPPGDIPQRIETPPPREPLAPNPQQPRLEGVWLQIPGHREQLGPGEYAAEFVELRLRQNGPAFTANFRSRYRIPDRVTKPDVNFEFSGSVDAQEFPWQGANGSHGKVRLTLESSGILYLEWSASAPIPGSPLSEGSSRLLRRLSD